MIIASTKSMQEVPGQQKCSEVKNILISRNLDQHFNLDVVSCSDSVLAQLKESMTVKQTTNLQNLCLQKPKLRTFVNFRQFGITPSYITIPMSLVRRKFLDLLRLSNLAIRLETGRYERPRID